MRLALLLAVVAGLIVMLTCNREPGAGSASTNTAVSQHEVPAMGGAPPAVPVARIEVDSTPMNHAVTIALRGQIVDQQGHGVSGSVSIDERTTRRGPTPFERFVETGRDGRFAQTVPRGGVYLVVAEVDNLAPSLPRELRLDEITDEIVLRVAPWCTIGGIVVREDGASITTGVITLMSEEFDPQHTLEPYAVQRAHLQSDGEFLFARAHPGLRYRVLYQAEGAGPFRTVRDGVRPDDRAVRVTVLDQELRGGRLSATILDAAGTPLTAYDVRVADRDPALARGSRWHTVRDPEGRFTLDDLPWNRELDVSIRRSGKERPTLAGRCRIDRPDLRATYRLRGR